MKILIYTDPHFCEKYSIVNKMGDKYTQRLENVIKSINWAEGLARIKDCQYVICAGDFFDKAQLTDQELTALQDIHWAPCAHFFLVGNHESEENDLHYNSTKALEGENRFIISEPVLSEENGFELAFLPYIPEALKQDISKYFPKKKAKRLLISHNDLLGIQLGPITTATGFKPADLETICDLCINGHLHNGYKVTDKVINLGNLTGKDFGEDAFRYSHNVLIFDTDTWTYEFIKNPDALNFYQIPVNSKADLERLKNLEGNAIVSIQCKATLIDELRETMSNISNIVVARVVIIRELITSDSEADITDLTVDQYVKFAECCREKLAASDILEAELAEILK